MTISYSKSLLLGILISFTALNVMSQGIEFVEEQEEKYSGNAVVPGNLFSVTESTGTGAVTSITGEDLYKTPAPNFFKGLSGLLPGLFVVQREEAPDYNNNVRMYVRGLGTYALGWEGRSIKLFLDGFEVNQDYLQNIPSSEIANVSVLKDAADLATFGMKGSNGVLWIETKRGVAGAPVITFQARTGIQQGININKPLRSFDYANLYNQAISNDNGRIWTPEYSPSQLSAYQNGTGTDVNWYDEVYKKNGSFSDFDLSFRGGSQTARYNILLGYANQQGLFNVKNTEHTHNVSLEKYSLRANVDITFNQYFEAGVNFGGRLDDSFWPNYNASDLAEDVRDYPSNIYPIYDPESHEPIANWNLSGTAVYPNNPVGSLTGLGWRTAKNRLIQANFKFKENLDFLLDGLYLEQGVSYFAQTIARTGKTRNYQRNYGGVGQTSTINSYISAQGFSSNGMTQWIQGNMKVGYKGIFDKHAINAALSLFVSDYKGQGSTYFSFATHYLNYNGRINYAYDNRYVAEFGFSYFGSDAYAPGNRFGFYPTLSAAWIVSNESFLESSDIIPYLKLRGSVGTTGGFESNISTQTLEDYGAVAFASDGRFLYQQYYANRGGFVTGFGPSLGNGSAGWVPVFVANKDVFAEKSLKYNIGFDMNVFRKLNVSFDAFMDKRTGILTYDQSVMNYYGQLIYLNNVGKMTNKGFEVSLSYNGKAGDFTYSLFGSAFMAKNTVDYMAEVTPAHPYNALTGLPYSTKMGMEYIGFYQMDDFDTDGNLKASVPTPLFGAVQPGDLKYKDQDGDGFVDNTDIVEIGNPFYPQFGYSFGGEVAYKGFDLSVFFSGLAGSTVNLADYNEWKAFYDYGNAYEWAKGAWAYYPDQNIDTRANATYPRLTTQQNENNYRNSSFWIRKNDFLRLKNIELGYDFSNHYFVQNAKISKLRLYVNAYNPLTFSSLLKDYNFDPESTYGYPAIKSYNMGIQITF